MKQPEISCFAARGANCSGLLGKKTHENEILREELARGKRSCGTYLSGGPGRDAAIDPGAMADVGGLQRAPCGIQCRSDQRFRDALPPITLAHMEAALSVPS
jgi:hypothetical protein